MLLFRSHHDDQLVALEAERLDALPHVVRELLRLLRRNSRICMAMTCGKNLAQGPPDGIERACAPFTGL